MTHVRATSRHLRIVDRAERLAETCFYDRVDPTDEQIVTTVFTAMGPPTNDHERLVSLQAYAARWEYLAYGG